MLLLNLSNFVFKLICGYWRFGCSGAKGWGKESFDNTLLESCFKKTK